MCSTCWWSFCLPHPTNKEVNSYVRKGQFIRRSFTRGTTVSVIDLTRIYPCGWETNSSPWTRMERPKAEPSGFAKWPMVRYRTDGCWTRIGTMTTEIQSDRKEAVTGSRSGSPRWQRIIVDKLALSHQPATGLQEACRVSEIHIVYHRHEWFIMRRLLRWCYSW